MTASWRRSTSCSTCYCASAERRAHSRSMPARCRWRSTCRAFARTIRCRCSMRTGRCWCRCGSATERKTAAHWDLPQNLACVVMRAAAVHAVPARSGRQPVCRADRLHAGRAAVEPGRCSRIPISTASRNSPRRWQQAQAPSSSPATCCICPGCGGTRSRAGRDRRDGQLLVARRPGADDPPLHSLLHAAMTMHELPEQ